MGTPGKRGMEADFRRARYELITRHALALAGVQAAEIYLLDRADGPLRLGARTVAPSNDSPLDYRAPDSADSPPTEPDRARFFDNVLATTGLHHTSFEVAESHTGPS